MIGPVAIVLLSAAIVAAFVKSALEQKARRLQRADGPDWRAAAGRARLWRGIFYALALGALGAAVLGW